MLDSSAPAGRSDPISLYHDLRLFDELAEMSVIGAALIDSDVRLRLMPYLTPQDFMLARHATIWAAMGQLIEDGIECDSLALKNKLAQLGALESSGGYDHLVTCM